MKNKIIYVMDPLCGWTYGNSENFLNFYNEYKDVFEFEILPGGIKINEEVCVGGKEMTDYVRKTGKIIQSLTRAEFSERYFEQIAGNSRYLFDSTPPSKAIITVNFIDAEKSIPYAHLLQVSAFVYGDDINDEGVLARLAEESGIDRSDFIDLYSSELVSDITKSNYTKVRKMNVDSFPSIYIKLGSKIKNIGYGYMSQEELRKAAAFCFVDLQ